MNVVEDKEPVFYSGSSPSASVNKEIFKDLFFSGSTYDELASAFNIHKGSVFNLITKWRLKRERIFRQRKKGKSWCVSQMKSPSLRSCRNPDCDYYFYGYKGDKYCCPECQVHAANLRSADYRKAWCKKNKKHLSAYHKRKRLERKQKMEEKNDRKNIIHFKNASKAVIES